MVVLGHRHGQRRALVLPVGDQLVERDRIDHRARQDVRADLAALLEDANATARVPPRRRAASGGSRRSVRRARRRRSPRHRPWIRARSSFLLVAAAPHNSTRLPCQFLDRGVNGGEETPWAGKWNRSALPRRAAHWPGGSTPASMSPCRKSRATGSSRRPRPRSRAGRTRAGAEHRRAQPRNPCRASRLAGRKRTTCRWRRQPPEAILPHGPKHAAVMLLSDAPALEDFAAGQPIGGEAWALATSGCSRRSGSPPIRLIARHCPASIRQARG